MGWPWHFIFTWEPCFLRSCIALGLTGSEMSGLLKTLKPETPAPNSTVTPGSSSLLQVETITFTKTCMGGAVLHYLLLVLSLLAMHSSCRCPGLAWHRASTATGEDKRWLIAKPKNHPSHSSYPTCSSFQNTCITCR